jgi:hypothetical protein
MTSRKINRKSKTCICGHGKKWHDFDKNDCNDEHCCCDKFRPKKLPLPLKIVSEIFRASTVYALGFNNGCKFKDRQIRLQTLKEVKKHHDSYWDKTDPTPNKFYEWLTAKIKKLETPSKEIK